MVNTAENTQVRALRRSPAAHLWEDFTRGSVEGSHGVALHEVPFQTMVGIRVDPLSEAGVRIAAVTGGLPVRCGEVAAGPDGVSVLWLSPDEFLAVAPDDGGRADLVEALTAALGADAGQVVDLSSNRTTFELSGPSAREVLEKSCAADLHPRAFAAGTAITTEVGKIPVLLWKSGPDTFRLFPRASFADYLGRWLLDGMREFAAAGNPAWH
ncbi:sarcosine oxidase subunit gamma [Arthrobacter sp. STN4]|uniref:sarcosine oxidase subunit gamma n=1 Tax=Arthrobacter sp. STN4 TaxID=2923276 RepID=UPI00211A81DD|nr:sarcosine oxidase subunit gamma family protein [Arthrobacter sp. STN4]MCQ9164458.1 sarcosine oxidase subunit gamma [Arthrobacter sp. STN4]